MAIARAYAMMITGRNPTITSSLLVDHKVLDLIGKGRLLAEVPACRSGERTFPRLAPRKVEGGRR